MDPALHELLLTEETVAGREIEAIIRLRRPEVQVPGVRLVAVFGTVATCRLPASAVRDTRRHPNVASLKAPRRLAPEREDARPGGGRPSDVRRPPNLGLTGRGVVVGVVDWGLDFDHANFKHEITNAPSITKLPVSGYAAKISGSDRCTLVKPEDKSGLR